MKKIILILFLLFVTTIKVDALEYGVWTDEVSSDENSRVVDSETRYRWYKDNTIYSQDYYIEGENDSAYPYISYADYIRTDWSDWVDTRAEDKPNRTIQYKSVNRYRTLRPIRYLFITDLTSFSHITKISEMNVLINNAEIPVSVTCTDCSLNFGKYVTDGYFQGGSFMNDGGTITIDLGDYYNINEIGLEMFVYSDSADTKTFNVYYNEGSIIDDRNYAKRFVYFCVGETQYYEADRFYVIPDAASITNPVYNDWVYIDGFVNATYYRQMVVSTLSRYRDYKYRYYTVERSYLDGYYSNLEDSSYVKDEESTKTYYLYEYINPSSENTNELTEEENNESEIDDSLNDGVDDQANEDEDDSSDEGDSEIPQSQPSVNNQQEENSIEVKTSSYLKEDKTNLNAAKITSEYLDEQSITIANDNVNINADDKNNFLEPNRTKIQKKENNSKSTIYKLLNNFIKYALPKLFIIFTILVFLTSIVLFKLRHHILSHQN
jgi:hypothetical protein